MILLMLRDGTVAEVTQGADVIHRKQSLICIDAEGEPITSFHAPEVIAYTCSEACARRFTAEIDADEETQSSSPELQTPSPANGRSSQT